MPSFRAHAIGNLAKHLCLGQAERREVVPNTSQSRYQVHVDGLKQMGLLTTNSEVYESNELLVELGTAVTTAKLAKECLSGWEKVVPTFAGLSQGDECYNFTFTGIGPQLISFARTDQAVSHGNLLSGLLGVGRQLWLLMYHMGWEPLDDALRNWFATPGLPLSQGGKILTLSCVRAGSKWQGTANPALCSEKQRASWEHQALTKRFNAHLAMLLCETLKAMSGTEHSGPYHWQIKAVAVTAVPVLNQIDSSDGADLQLQNEGAVTKFLELFPAATREAWRMNGWARECFQLIVGEKIINTGLSLLEHICLNPPLTTGVVGVRPVDSSQPPCWKPSKKQMLENGEWQSASHVYRFQTGKREAWQGTPADFCDHLSALTEAQLLDVLLMLYSYSKATPKQPHFFAPYALVPLTARLDLDSKGAQRLWSATCGLYLQGCFAN